MFAWIQVVGMACGGQFSAVLTSRDRASLSSWDRNVQNVSFKRSSLVLAAKRPLKGVLVRVHSIQGRVMD